MEWIPFVIISGICLLIFLGIAIWALCRKTPMNFWAGSTVNPATISNIKKYNKANAIMWFCYCIPLVLGIVIAPIHISVAAAVMSIGLVFGIGPLIFVYLRIQKKYTNH